MLHVCRCFNKGALQHLTDDKMGKQSNSFVKRLSYLHALICAWNGRYTLLCSHCLVAYHCSSYLVQNNDC